MLFSWLNQRALRRRQEKLDAITKILGLDDPELLANDQRAMERGRLAQLAELRRREREGCDLLGRPQR